MEIKTLYVIAGPNGIGKTTCTYDLVPQGIPVINSDEIAKQVKLAGIATNINTQEYSNREASKLVSENIDRQISFGIETNLCDVETWKFLIGAQKIGYRLQLIFLSTGNIEILNKRIQERVQRGEHFDEHAIVKVDTNLIGIWKMAEDTDAHNYFVIEKYNDYQYAVTYMNRGGSNRTYENFAAFFSEIGSTKFFNVGYNYYDKQTETSDVGYFFLKVINIDQRGFDMTLALVSDTTMKKISSQKGVRERIAKNLNNLSFYDKHIHFHKILPLMYCK